MLTSDSSLLASCSYTFDYAGQRVTETAPGRARAFTYDALRQLTESNATATDPLLATKDDFAYDLIGNRTQVVSAVAAGPSATTVYAANTVNQYTALTGATVDTPAHDLNGNTVACANALQSPGGGGGALNLRYDEENRLVEASDAAHRSVYIYDGLGRRVGRQDFSWNLALGAWNFEREARFVYDGRNVIEDLDSGYTTLRSYTRGLDLSGSFEGAGGIGGQLAITTGGATPPSRTTASYFYDGNGNVTDLVNDDGTSAAHYTYSPFGDRLSATGSLADLNPYQFSTKERDSFTGFYYYGFRFYCPSTGRWPNRDPIGEIGGFNLYGFALNNPIDAIDTDGLLIVFVHGTWSNTVDAFPLGFVRDVQSHFGNDQAVRFFNWSGENNDAARNKAAEDLANLLRDYHKKNPCDPIRVVAHSHGGNVTLLASQQSDVHIDELVTLGTPALSRYARGSGLVNWDNVYSTNDGVQTLPMGAGRTNSTANSNIQLSGYGHSDLHTVPAWGAAFPAPPTPSHN
jgi:RHS repeat-associated protein